MKAIETRYISATNYRGARIKATAEGGLYVTIPYPQEYDTEAAHRIGAYELIAKMGWGKQSWFNGIVGGSTKRGYAWVFVPKETNA
jgi:hypothetical protein